MNLPPTRISNDHIVTPRTPRQKIDESPTEYKRRLDAHYRSKEVDDWITSHPDSDLATEVIEHRLSALGKKTAKQVNKEALNDRNDPHNAHVVKLPDLLEKPWSPETNERDLKALFASLISRVDKLEIERSEVHTISALTVRVKKLEELVAAFTPHYNRLSPAVKAKVDSIDPTIRQTHCEARVKALLDTFDYLLNLSSPEKRRANFPKEILNEVNYTAGTEVKCLIAPLSVLSNRCTRKKHFKPSSNEDSSVDNFNRALEESGLYVFTMAQAGLRLSDVKVVMTALEAEKRGLKKPTTINVVEPILPRATIIEDKWDDVEIVEEVESEPNPEYMDIPDEPQETTRPPVEEDFIPVRIDFIEPEENPEIDTETIWDEDEQPEHHPFLDFRESGKQEKEKKIKKVVDLFRD